MINRIVQRSAQYAIRETREAYIKEQKLLATEPAKPIVVEPPEWYKIEHPDDDWHEWHKDVNTNQVFQCRVWLGYNGTSAALIMCDSSRRIIELEESLSPEEAMTGLDLIVENSYS